MKKFNSLFKTKWLLVPLMFLTLSIGQMWGAVGNTITSHSSIADATVYYFAGVGSSSTTYYSVLGSDATGTSIAGNANATKSNGTKYTFLIEGGKYYILSPNGYFIEPGNSNGKLILTSDSNAVTVSTVSSKIRITGTTYTGRSWQKNKNTAAANFGGYGNTQNDLTLHVAGYRVIYDKNGATGGTVPSDATVYSDNATATIKANTGSLAKTGYTFSGWNTAANGSGTDVSASGSATKKITAGLRLYAKWTASASCATPAAPGKGSINGTSATLTFSESGNYEIYCSTSNTTPTGSTSASGSVSGGTSVTVSNLAYGTTYYYWGRKVCDENSKSNWVAGSATTFTTTIPAPTGLSAGSISKNGATFTITDANSVNNYEIYYSTTNSAPGASPSGTATTTSKTKEVTGLTVGATYYCWVRAKGPNANSSWFSGGSFATLHEYTLSYKETDETANGSGTVVENATSFTNSTAPSKTGYNLEGFYAESSLTTKVANASRQFVENVTNWTGASGAYTKGANANLYLNWTAKTTTVSFDIEGGSGTITNVTATYGQAMPSKESNLPTKEGYNFGGFWDGDDGTGTQYYDADGKSARTWNKEDATFTVTWKVNGEPWSDKGGTANVNHNTAWSSLTLPTAPDPDNDGCGQKFVGWTTEENYSNATTAPTDLLNADNKSSKTAVLITHNVVFHAVFADYDEE